MSFSAPFLVLDEYKKMMLLPLTLLHKEAPDPVDTSSWKEVPSVSTKYEFPLEKWVHVGCEVRFLRSSLIILGNARSYILILRWADSAVFLRFLGIT